jgi:hypothetical protein
MSSNDQLLIEAQRIRESGILGEARLRQLFDYVLEKTVAGEVPKELIIAVDVFGKDSSFNVGEDAVVRVYMHKLRKALISFYGSAAGSSGYALQIPKGEYRLRLQQPEPKLPERGPGVGTERRTWRHVVPSLLACAVLGAFTFALFMMRTPGSRHRDEMTEVRKSPVWSELLSDDRPITIVIGDYFLLGETDGANDVKRLIREFDINSPDDLERLRMQHPERARHLVDVGFGYLPTASANALRNVMAVLASENRRISVRLMSEMQVSALKSSDVVYIGFLSGMGMLQDLMFTGSRLQLGDSFDVLIDIQSGRAYASEDISQVLNQDDVSSSRAPYHDYGLFAKLKGPSGNSITIIAGTRDEGLEWTSQELTTVSGLSDVASRVDTRKPFEELLEVGAFEGVDMTGHVLFATPRS